MAHRPSKIMKHEMDEMHVNITPMMNLMVVLIPLLLSSAELVRLSIVELNLPPAAAGDQLKKDKLIPEENRKELDLTITVTDNGFFISSSTAVLSGTKAGEPSVALVDGEYDFDTLSEKLYKIKKKADEKFHDSDEVIIMAESSIKYQTIIKTMDAARDIRIEEKKIFLFPNVSFSAKIY